MSEVADLLVTVAFLVQSALLFWAVYTLHRCSTTIRKQAELIDSLRHLLRRQHHLLANILPEGDCKWMEVTTDVNHALDEAGIHLLTELLQELRKKEEH